MKLLGATLAPRVRGLSELPGVANYFIGNDPKKWHSNVPTYSKVEYQSVYPGIDLVFYGNQRQLEHDFIVAPGADPRSIRIGLEGAERLSIDVEGNLLLATRDGEVRFQKPVLYQNADGVRREISGGYALKGANQVGFQVAAYDVSRPLVIDPVLAYSTYLGGSASDKGAGIAVDGAGNAYVTGFTRSVDFPTTPGAFQTTMAGGLLDAYVTKLNPTGSGLVYSTYLGGSSDEEGTGIAVDSSGQAYVAGFSQSTNFPTTPGAFQTTKSGGNDAFVTKLHLCGCLLLYSTYLGGSGGDQGTGIAVDSAESAYVTGFAESANFPTTLGAFQTTGRADAFVTKLNSVGSALIYSTYLGGGAFDHAWGIAVDASFQAYVTGRTGSTDFPTTPGAFQTTAPSAGAFYDAFVTKLNPTGSGLAYSTYLGGASHYDEADAIAVDTLGSAYVTGFTFANDFPTTPGAYQPSGSGINVFVTKVDAAGSTLAYSTYLGGGGNNGGRGIAVDLPGNAYVTGATVAGSFPTVNAIQPVRGGAEDAFVTKLNPAGSGLVYSTFLGGAGNEEGWGIALDASSNAYVTGFTLSANFVTTAGAFQTALNGQDAFVAKISEAIPAAATTTTLSSSLNPSAFGQSVTFTATVNSSAGTPTGTVTFRDGVQTLGTGPLNASGQATLTTSTLSTGSHSITAFYPGNSNFSASTSPVLTQTVTNDDACGTFAAAVTYATGLQPISVAVGDVNGDGRQDLAVANQSSGDVSILLGIGDGTFAGPTNYGTGSSPRSVAAADFNGDSRLDLAVARPSSGVSILIGNGNGTFQAAVDYPGGADSVAVGDFNGDGKLDLALVNNGSHNVLIRLGNGDGTFQAAAGYGVGTSPVFAAVADFNGDGRPDLAITNQGSNNVSILLGNVNGTFQAAVHYGVGSNPISVAVADFNGDGNQDLAVANFFLNQLSVLLGNGNGTFQPAVNYGVPSTSSVAVGDFNGDGYQDLVATNYFGGGVSVLKGNGDGTFQTPVGYGTGSLPFSLAVGDFNTDGRPDLAVGNTNSNTVSILLGTCPCSPSTTDDGNPCTVDTCNPSTGAVTHTPGNSGTQCRAGNGVCDPAEICDGAGAACPGDAKASTTTSCSDSNSCTTADHCDGTGACVGGSPVVCTASDQCHNAGACDPTSGACSNPPKTNGSTCTDGNACTNNDSCQGGACSSGIATVCTASDQCHDAGVCDSTTGSCSNPVKADGSSCTDGNACTTGDACGAGSCQPGTGTVNVDDGNVCTTDSCDPTSGAVHTPGNAGTTCRASAGECDEAESCTGSSAACPTDGFKASGTACTDDGDACTDDVCTGTMPACTHVLDTHCAGCVGNAPPVVTGTTATDPMTISGGNASVSATFTDAPGQTHTCSISWGDGSPDSPGTVSETNGSGTCTGSHSYAAQTTPVVYEVTITVTDDCGGAGTGVTYVVLYDPNGGFVTGGGWINSPPLAYLYDPAAVGKANFGFVSKYKKVSTVPEGNTNFHFNAVGFKFESDTYEWLVISGPKARYRGTGSVNGVAGYGFELTAWDGQVSGGAGVDRFRIKIWQGSPGNVIYDNENGSPDGEATTPSSVLGGGSIVIHKK